MKDWGPRTLAASLALPYELDEVYDFTMVGPNPYLSPGCKVIGASALELLVLQWDSVELIIGRNAVQYAEKVRATSAETSVNEVTTAVLQNGH